LDPAALLFVLYLLRAGRRCSRLRLSLRPRIPFLANRVATLIPLCFTLFAVFTDLLLLLSILRHRLSALELLSNSAYFGHNVPP
jgi:hypothetical protein